MWVQACRTPAAALAEGPLSAAMLSRLAFDALAALALAFTAVLGAYTPAYLARRDRLAGGSGRSLVYVLGNMLSAGVMVSAGFCHLLGEALKQMPKMVFPLAPFLCGTGYLFTLVADRIAANASGHGHPSGCGHQPLPTRPPPADSNRRQPDSAERAEQRGGLGGRGSGLGKHSSDPEPLCLLDGSPVQGPRSQSSAGAAQGGGGGGVAALTGSSLRFSAAGSHQRHVHSAAAAAAAAAGNGHSHGHSQGLANGLQQHHSGSGELLPTHHHHHHHPSSAAGLLGLPPNGMVGADGALLPEERSGGRPSIDGCTGGSGGGGSGGRRPPTLHRDSSESLVFDIESTEAAEGPLLGGPAGAPPSSSGGSGGGGRQVSFLTAMLMGVALCFHSLLEGAAMGAQPTISNSLHIFIAIVSHKGLAAYALGSSIVDSDASMRRFWSVILPFTFASPVGIFLGFIVSDLAKGVGAASISALASGTFLYVAFMEVIPKELREPEHVPLKLAALLFGFCAMSVLALWA